MPGIVHRVESTTFTIQWTMLCIRCRASSGVYRVASTRWTPLRRAPADGGLHSRAHHDVPPRTWCDSRRCPAPDAPHRAHHDARHSARTTMPASDVPLRTRSALPDRAHRTTAYPLTRSGRPTGDPLNRGSPAERFPWTEPVPAADQVAVTGVCDGARRHVLPHSVRCGSTMCGAAIRTHRVHPPGDGAHPMPTRCAPCTAPPGGGAHRTRTTDIDGAHYIAVVRTGCTPAGAGCAASA